MADKSKIYWASKPVEEIAGEILHKVQHYQKFTRDSNILGLWRRCWEFYHRSAVTGGRLRKSGDAGEYSLINVNQYRNILLNLKVQTISSRPAYECRASNTDVKSLESTILGEGLLEYYVREKTLGRKFDRMVENGLVLRECFMEVSWDPEAGEERVADINPETYGETLSGVPVRDGDVRYRVFTPDDVIRDYTKTSNDLHQWFILRCFENKYDLAAQFPEMEDEILSTPAIKIGTDTRIVDSWVGDDTDDIVCYILYHAPTPSLPSGRYTYILDSEHVLLDGALPYDRVPVYRLAPGEMLKSCFGYSPSLDLLPLQQQYDNVSSIITTNQNAFGVGNVLVPAGSNFTSTSLAGGMNLLEYDPTNGLKPEVLQLTATPAEVFNFREQLAADMETIAGINSVVRGNPETAGMSGAAMALLEATSIKFSAALQASYVQLLEDVGDATLYLLKTFAKTPRVAAIVGKANRSYMKSYEGADLEPINRVLVDVANPVTKTIAGKLNLADTLLKTGLIENGQQYITVATTGRLEPLYEGTEKELLLIKDENEKLQDGVDVPVIVTDNHLVHIKEHKVVLASTEARMEPRILQATLKHIQEHIDMLQNPMLSPLLMALGQQPMAPMGPVGAQAPAAPLLDANAQADNLPNLPAMPGAPVGADQSTVDVINNMQPPQML